MAGYLEKAGYASEADPGRAATIILNTCGFIGPARAEAETAIRDAARLKKKNPPKKIIVTGCYPSAPWLSSGRHFRTSTDGSGSRTSTASWK